MRPSRISSYWVKEVATRSNKREFRAVTGDSSSRLSDRLPLDDADRRRDGASPETS